MSDHDEQSKLVRAQFAAHLDVAGALTDELVGQVAAVGAEIVLRLQEGGKLLAFGNGGSAAQADHLVGELIGRYRSNRAPLPAVSLSASPGVVTCIANDFGYEYAFSRQVQALVRPEDVAVGLSTSGSSQNVLRGLAAARGTGALSVLLTGHGLQSAAADHVIGVPSTSTARIQEVHLLVIHSWCELIEATFS